VLHPGAMRLLLALIVIAVHYSQLAKLPIRLVPLDAVSVYGFFFLSGFWVCRLWDQKYSQTRAPLLTFYVSRTLRIYPLAWCSVFIAFCAIEAHRLHTMRGTKQYYLRRFRGLKTLRLARLPPRKGGGWSSAPCRGQPQIARRSCAPQDDHVWPGRPPSRVMTGAGNIRSLPTALLPLHCEPPSRNDIRLRIERVPHKLYMQLYRDGEGSQTSPRSSAR